MGKKSLIFLIGLQLVLGVTLLGEAYGGACGPEGVCMPYVSDSVEIMFDGAITVDGDISDWPSEAKVGDLWVANKPPKDVGDVYLKYDGAHLYIGVATKCPSITLHYEGQFVRFDTTGDGCVDIQDNNGNTTNPPCNLSTLYELGDCAYEYRFTMSEIGLHPGDCFGFFAHAEVKWKNGSTETATFPKRPVGEFKFITVCFAEDTVPPVITCPDDVVAECTGPNGAYIDGLIATAEDETDPDPVITNDYNDGGADASDWYPIGTTVVTFTATDYAGNTASCQVTVTVVDTTPPELHGVPGNITVECDAVPVPPEVTATDGCDPNPLVQYNEVRTDGPCADAYTLTRTWTATDGYGNSVSQSQVITVEDTTPPVLAGIPEGDTVECDAVPDPAQVTATDNCDPDPDLVYSEVRTDGPCEDEYTLTRTWTATDRCGNSSSGTQVIYVMDTTPPVLAGIAEGDTVECDQVPGSGEVTATDNCDPDPDLVYSEVRTDGPCEDEYTLTRTWTATDRCGNSSSGTQTIYVVDTTPPVLAGIPEGDTVECDQVPGSGEVTATDNCDPDPDLVYNEVRTDGPCEDEYTLTRTWTATDRCGNSSSGTQTIYVVDTTPPVLAAIPEGDTVECDAVPAPANVTATDNCDPDPDLIYNEVRTDGPCADEYTLTRTWTATDRCGNSSSGTQTIYVMDTTPPVLAGVPPDATVECDAVPAPANVTATDNCDPDPDLVYNEVRTDGRCADEYTLTRTWTATDRCGNSASKIQVIYVVDTTPPVITCPDPDTLFFQCADEVPVPDPNAATATDNCDNDVDITFSDWDNGGAGCVDDPLIIIWTYTAMDNCGNQASCYRTIIVKDTIPPEITCPPDVIVEPDPGDCIASGDSVDIGTAVASDNCGHVTITNDAPETYPIGVTIVIWTATDACGNTSTCTQLVTVRMHVDAKPTSCPNPLQIQSGGANVPFAILGCDGFDVTQIDQSTVRVEGVKAMRFNLEDVTRPVPDPEDSCDCTEEGGDGYTDLTFKVKRNALVDALEERLGRALEDGEEIAVYVTANLKAEFGGGALIGMDCMVVNRGGSGPSAALTVLSGPRTFGLSQNRPNPLHGTTIIHYQLPTTATTTLRIYDVTGRVVKTLASGIRKPGYYAETWDATDDKGREVPNGVYFYSMRAGSHVFTKQMILIR